MVAVLVYVQFRVRCGVWRKVTNWLTGEESRSQKVAAGPRQKFSVVVAVSSMATLVASASWRGLA